MKIRNLIIISSLLLLFVSCTKDPILDNTAQVKIRIDYLGSGGYYNDNIDGVPTGLIVGMNGPFTVSTDRSYTMVYKANSNFPETSLSNWTPTAGKTWVIHCYVSGNYEYIRTYME